MRNALAMPWEAKRWFVFAGLMFLGSLWALTYESDDVQRRSIIDTEVADTPTIPLRRPGPGETPPPSRVPDAVEPTPTGIQPADPAVQDAGEVPTE